jgi:septum formation inhibitor MinC
MTLFFVLKMLIMLSSENVKWDPRIECKTGGQKLEKLKQSIKEARKDLKTSNDVNNKIRVKIQKKQFRKVQRRNIFIYENNKNKNIENHEN